MMLLAAAMQKAETVDDMTKVATALINLREYRHSALDMYFNEDRETVYAQSVGIVKDGKVSYVIGR
jgi:hypothetical protein